MKRFLIILFSTVLIHTAKAQNVSVKTNLLYDATASINAGFETKLAPQWSLDVSGDYNGWTIQEHKWKHWFAQPEIRYWFCDAFAKHFVGAHLIGGQFNVGNIKGLPNFLGSDFSKLADERYQGWGAGAGLAYGYALPLNQRWNMEFEVGFGYVFLQYDVYSCHNCGKYEGNKNHHYVGPTKAALNLVYIF